LSFAAVLLQLRYKKSVKTEQTYVFIKLIGFRRFRENPTNLPEIRSTAARERRFYGFQNFAAPQHEHFPPSPDRPV